MTLKDDCNPPAAKKSTQDVDSQLTRKQKRNQRKMKKNSRKKNKYKHLALNKPCDIGEKARGSFCSGDGHKSLERRHSADFSQPELVLQADFSSERSTHSVKKGKKGKPSQLSSSVTSLGKPVSAEAQRHKSVSVAPVAVTCPKKKRKMKIKAMKDQKERKVRKMDLSNISTNSKTETWDCSDSDVTDDETSGPETFELGDRSYPQESTAKTGGQCPQRDMSKKTKVVLSALDKAREKLQSARFRYLNEQLYTSTGGEAWRMFQEDPESFSVYHQGFQLQVAQWPVNPLDDLVRQLAKMPKSTVVADFGCGDARLAESLPDNVVHSFDLVASKPCVTACDIAKVPLSGNSVDVAVFCLSLMGTNLSDYLCEANRVLHKGGQLKIAEVVSRFYRIGRFVKNVEALGFHLQKKVFLDKMFMLFTFKKVSDACRKQAPPIELKACYYKRR
ncbi:hypothetical protein ACOMHN_053010 [Nucella lapillus]